MNAKADRPVRMDNIITRGLGIDFPILQAPMGWIARSQLASAVCEAGGLGIIETSSGEIEIVKQEIQRMSKLTSNPFGVNLPALFLKDMSIVDFIVQAGVKFVTTSAGDPTVLCQKLKSSGINVFHVVPTLAAAMKAEDAGVDGLIVEGGEGGGFKGNEPVSTMVLLPLVRSRTELPIVAAGGIVDGASMAAAFVLGADGVQMGTRMVASQESPVHANWKKAILDASETGTVLLNRQGKPSVRVLRTDRASELDMESQFPVMEQFANAKELYFGGDMEASLALCGQAAGRVVEIERVADIIWRTVTEFRDRLADVARACAKPGG